MVRSPLTLVLALFSAVDRDLQCVRRGPFPTVLVRARLSPIICGKVVAEALIGARIVQVHMEDGCCYQDFYDELAHKGHLTD